MEKFNTKEFITINGAYHTVVKCEEWDKVFFIPFGIDKVKIDENKKRLKGTEYKYFKSMKLKDYEEVKKTNGFGDKDTIESLIMKTINKEFEKKSP